MQTKLQQTRVLRQNLLLAVTLTLISLSGLLSAQSSIDSVITEPYSIDSLYISPAIPQEGDVITLHAVTTLSSSPCGMEDYDVVRTSSNTIYVIARYWQGMLTALCQSHNTMRLDSLSAGHYVLNFMHLKTLEFTVYPRVECKADFSYYHLRCDSMERCFNAVRFEDKSLGFIQSWHWDFGDSTFSTEQNPVHHFAHSGIFPVTLTVTGGVTNECHDQVTKLVPMPSVLCSAFFSYEVIALPYYELSSIPDIGYDYTEDFRPFLVYLVKFHDLSVGDVTEWDWDFGDGSTSTEQNPVREFMQGNYTVTLKITTSSNCESIYQQELSLFDSRLCIHTGTVRDYTGLDGCHYIIELDSGPKLEPVHVPDSFEFYDGQRVILGYEPLLDVASICMVGIPAYITCIREISEPVCKAYFTYAPDSLADCICFYFFDQSHGGVINWHWDFGDGTTSDEQNPHHVFPIHSGFDPFNVCLTIVTANGCTDTYCETVVPFTPHPIVPWKPIIGGEDNHTIVVSEKLGVTAGLEYGDYIGLFFRDYWGMLQCGGMIRWEGANGILTAWENTGINDSTIIIWRTEKRFIFPVPVFKNGFDEGEKFEFKIWKWRNDQVIDIEHAEYTVNNIFPDSGYYKDDGLSLLTRFTHCHSQEIKLHTGWNMVSLNVEPVDPLMQNIFGNIPVVVKNYKGEIVYFPYIGITDGIWNILEGYKVKSFENAILRIPGNTIDPQLTIQLPGTRRPYFLPYFYTQAYPIRSMMRNVADNIRYVQTFEYINGVVRALNYIPQYGIDQIHTMKPGYAYKISFITPMRSFTYPYADEDTVWIPCYETKSTSEPSIVADPEMENNRILVVPEEVLSISAGARVTVYADNNIQVGNEIAEGGNLALTMWDLPDNEYMIITLNIEDENKTESYTINLSQQTNVDDGMIVLTKGMITGIDPAGASTVHRLYPTIAENEVHLELYLEKYSDVSVILYDMLGNRVGQFDFSNAGAGVNHFIFAVGNLANGQYLYSVKTADILTRGKFQVQR
ncbi:MAG: PKD domain-containing protein [Bacteroidales bacterium]|nr:PKD domain-containing protein [Bacteroidales bacterium]